VSSPIADDNAAYQVKIAAAAAQLDSALLVCQVCCYAVTERWHSISSSDNMMQRSAIFQQTEVARSCES
jgi:hypothetical protein